MGRDMLDSFMNNKELLDFAFKRLCGDVKDGKYWNLQNGIIFLSKFGGFHMLQADGFSAFKLAIDEQRADLFDVMITNLDARKNHQFLAVTHNDYELVRYLLDRASEGKVEPHAAAAMLATQIMVKPGAVKGAVEDHIKSLADANQRNLLNEIYSSALTIVEEKNAAELSKHTARLSLNRGGAGSSGLTVS